MLWLHVKNGCGWWDGFLCSPKWYFIRYFRDVLTSKVLSKVLKKRLQQRKVKPMQISIRDQGGASQQTLTFKKSFIESFNPKWFKVNQHSNRNYQKPTFNEVITIFSTKCFTNNTTHPCQKFLGPYEIWAKLRFSIKLVDICWLEFDICLMWRYWLMCWSISRRLWTLSISNICSPDFTHKHFNLIFDK